MWQTTIRSPVRMMNQKQRYNQLQAVTPALEVFCVITTTWFRSLSGSVQSICQEVFVSELGHDIQHVFDAHDEGAHAVLLSDGDTPVATGRVYACGDDYVIGRTAVIPSRRGERLGDMVTRLLLYKAQRLGAKTVSVYAQPHAVDYYARFGFVPQDGPIGEPGIFMRVAAEAVRFPRDCEAE